MKLDPRAIRNYLRDNFKRSWLKIPFVIGVIKNMQVELEKEMDNIKFFLRKKLLFDLKKAGYKLAIISSNRVENINKFIKHNKINIFDFVHGKTDLLAKQVIYEKFLRDFKLEKSEVIYMGDEIRDVEASQKVGIKIIGVSWGLHTIEAMKKPELII